jgi:hypothetical protein
MSRLAWPLSGAVLLLACGARAPPPCGAPTFVAEEDSPCRTPMALELRGRRIAERLRVAYARSPPVSVAERAQMQRLQECLGAAMLGAGDGCIAERDATRASGLERRYRIRGGEADVSELVGRAAAKPLGARRTDDLLVALATAAAAATLLDDAAQVPIGLVAADLEQAIVCDAEDMAGGRRRGLPYDAHAPIPDGP